MVFKQWRDDIREKTQGMTVKGKVSYICTYYWYHLLISIALISLLVLLTGHFLFGKRPPQFYCAMVNQPVTDGAVGKMTETFAAEAGLEAERTVIDAGYIFSYGGNFLPGANESTYEKFFLQWENQEIDAVIMPESFYTFCREMGGGFLSMDRNKLGSFEAYTDSGACTAAVLGKDYITGEALLLAFPDTGRHTAAAETFLDYLNCVKDGRIGGITYEEIIDR